MPATTSSRTSSPGAGSSSVCCSPSVAASTAFCKRCSAPPSATPSRAWALGGGRHYVIPDELAWGGLVIGLLLALGGGVDGFLQALLGAAVGFVLLWLVGMAGTWVFKEEAMGGGDVKMMAMVGSFVGWRGVLLTVFAGAALGSLIFIPLSIKKKRLVPFGVFLAVGAAVAFLFGDVIIAWYGHFLKGD